MGRESDEGEDDEEAEEQTEERLLLLVTVDERGREDCEETETEDD